MDKSLKFIAQFSHKNSQHQAEQPKNPGLELSVYL